MKSLTRHQFEHIAYHYVGMAEFSGYHSTGGVWVYNHNYVNNAWKMWQEFQKLSDERLSDRESEIRAEYTYCTPPEQTIRTQQATIERLTEQLKDMVETYQYEASSENPTLLAAKALIAEIEASNE